MAQSQQGFAVDSSGLLLVDVGAAIYVGTPASAAPTSAALVGGSDGTDLRAFLTSTTGQLHVIADTGSTTVVTGTVAVQGTLTNDNAAPSTNNVGVLPALVVSSAPTFTAGHQSLLTVGTDGALRVNVVEGSAGTTQYNDGDTPTPPIVGTAVLGQDSAGEVHVLNTDVHGNLDVTPSATSTSQFTHAAISSSSTGDITIIGGTSLQTIRVMELHIQLSGLTTGTSVVTFKDGASTALTGAYTFRNGGEFGRENNGDPLFITSAGNAFIINQSATAQISGYVKYTKSA